MDIGGKRMRRSMLSNLICENVEDLVCDQHLATDR